MIDKQESLSWSSVVNHWRTRESGLWEEHIQENKYKDWDDFRLGPRGTLVSYGYAPELLAELNWSAHEISPEAIWNCMSGPFKGWARFNPFGTADLLPFSLLASHPELQNNPRVLAAHQLLDEERELHGIALHAPDRPLVLIDGLHTATALAQTMLMQKKPQARFVLHVAQLEKMVVGPAGLEPATKRL